MLFCQDEAVKPETCFATDWGAGMEFKVGYHNMDIA